jgi:hypothetical protein
MLTKVESLCPRPRKYPKRPAKKWSACLIAQGKHFSSWVHALDNAAVDRGGGLHHRGFYRCVAWIRLSENKK